jgi:hypothetical protein
MLEVILINFKVFPLVGTIEVNFGKKCRNMTAQHGVNLDI